MVRKLLIVLFILNLFDTAATYFGLRFQLIDEGNPIMHALYDYSPILFITFKIGVSLFLLFFILSDIPLKSSILKAVSITAVGYSMVSALHLYWIFY
jgi:hypothetical protein